MKFKTKIILLLFVVSGMAFLAGGLYFAENKLNRSNLNISGAVVPHHNLVAAQRAEFFSELAKHITAPETIILLSPNHFYAGSGSIQTTDQRWQLGQGQINPDQNVISYLVENNLAFNEPPSFVNEHGIFNILSDIHNNFPDAEIVPLIFENPGQNQLAELEKGLENSCGSCLMIASVDFSHDQPALLAQQNDECSIADLKTRDATGILKNAKVDSTSALALLAMWATDHNTLNFILKGHDIGTTTHVFGWYEAK